MNNRFKRMRGNVLRKIAGLPLIVAVVTVFVIGSPQVAAAQAWSPWLDRDDPSGKGDYETVVDFKKAGKICANPIQIQCRFVGDTKPWPANPPTGYTCNTQVGGYCENTPTLQCRDIEVRFLCPKGLGGTPTATETPSITPSRTPTPTVSCAAAGGPACNGACPPGEVCAYTGPSSNTSFLCGCVAGTPCADTFSSAPQCGGNCPAGMECKLVQSQGQPPEGCGCFFK